MSQRIEGRRQKTDGRVPLCVRGTFIKVAVAPRQHLCLLFSAICLLLSALCHAEELPDPTRPPSIITIPAATGGRAPSGLQSIIISKTRRAAIIDGETVELKGKHGDATLIEVNETGVVLQGAQGRQVLTLFPDVKVVQKEIQATPKLPVKEGGLAQKTKLKARKEHK